MGPWCRPLVNEPWLCLTIKPRGYQRALWLYETVDSASRLLGTAALANRIGQDTFLGFLKNLSPKPEKAQTIDLVVKLVAEVVAFCQHQRHSRR